MDQDTPQIFMSEPETLIVLMRSLCLLGRKSEASVDTPKCVENGLQHQQIGAFEGDEDVCSPVSAPPLFPYKSSPSTPALFPWPP